jgi:DNA-directed RNA polymerase subunit RPC12/RpoP
MEPSDYYEQEEFIFPESGGVTGSRLITCSNCGTEYEVEVDSNNAAGSYECGNCGATFVVGPLDS